MLPFDLVHNPVWELHTSAATPPSLLFSVASTTNLVGHNVFTSFVDRHKNIGVTSKGLIVAWRLKKSACTFTQHKYPVRDFVLRPCIIVHSPNHLTTIGLRSEPNKHKNVPARSWYEIGTKPLELHPLYLLLGTTRKNRRV